MNDISQRIYELMLRKGYPEDFARLIAVEMCTEFTGSRMYGYIAANEKLRLEDVADEMLAIKSDRDRLIDKHISEHAQASINRMYREQSIEQEKQ